MNIQALPVPADVALLLLKIIAEYVYVVRVEPDGRVSPEWSNAAFEWMTGYSRQELEARGGWPAMIHPDDRDEVVRQYRRSIEGEPTTFEFRVITNTGVTKLVRNRLEPVSGEDGRVIRVCGAAQDLTRHAAADEALQSREKLLRDVLDALPVGVWFVDRTGKVQNVNAAGRRMWGGLERDGFANEEIYRRFNLRRPEDGQPITPEDSAVTRALMQGEASIDREIEIDLPDGTSRILQTSVLPLRDTDGTISGAICLNSDITGRKHLEGQLQQAQRMESIGRMAGGIAHDFNNLLTIIIGCAEMTLHFGNAGLAAAEWQETLTAARRASELTSQLLAFARQQPVAPRVVDLNSIVGHVEGLLRRLIREDVKLVVDAFHTVLPVNVDPGQFEQILLNLVVNARDAMPGGGTLTVRTSLDTVTPKEARLHAGLEPGPKVTLSVSDTGVGIPEDIRGRIFEPFFTTKGPGLGTGLGLAMCYGIVKQAGGFIGVESTEGVGTTFRVYLPVESRDIAVEPAVVRSPAMTTTARILLVEDERAVAELTKRALEMGGYRVFVAHSGTEALDVFGALEDPVDLLLTDVVMPDMRGTALARRMLEQSPQLRVMFVSGYPGPLEPDFSAARLLPKPFTPSELLRHVGEALRS